MAPLRVLITGINGCIGRVLRTALQAGLVIVRFYQELAPLLAQAHGITYPDALERVMVDRLEKLS